MDLLDDLTEYFGEGNSGFELYKPLEESYDIEEVVMGFVDLKILDLSYFITQKLNLLILILKEKILNYPLPKKFLIGN